MIELKLTKAQARRVKNAISYMRRYNPTWGVDLIGQWLMVPEGARAKVEAEPALYLFVPQHRSLEEI